MNSNNKLSINKQVSKGDSSLTGFISGMFGAKDTESNNRMRSASSGSNVRN